MISPYKHKIQYYESDQMGVVHHSNYIRWFEEARTDMLEKLGMSYAMTEERGILIPVVEVTCKYISMSRYGETVYIIPRVQQFSGVRLQIFYKVIDVDTGKLRASGESRHCFINRNNKIVSLAKADNELFDLYKGIEDIDIVDEIEINSIH